MKNKIKKAGIESVIAIAILKGEGTEKDPARIAIQYWDLEGRFLFEKDYCQDWQPSSGSIKEFISCNQ